MLMAPCRVSVDLPVPVQAKRQGGMSTTNSIKKINSHLSIHIISFLHPLDLTFTNQQICIFFHPFLHIAHGVMLKKSISKGQRSGGFFPPTGARKVKKHNSDQY